MRTRSSSSVEVEPFEVAGHGARRPAAGRARRCPRWMGDRRFGDGRCPAARVAEHRALLGAQPRPVLGGPPADRSVERDVSWPGPTLRARPAERSTTTLSYRCTTNVNTVTQHQPSPMRHSHLPTGRLRSIGARSIRRRRCATLRGGPLVVGPPASCGEHGTTYADAVSGARRPLRRRRGQSACRRAPLAERLRPRRLDDVVGHEQLLGPGRPLRALVDADRLSSLILWGPPGTGKTTLRPPHRRGRRRPPSCSCPP